MRRGPSLKQIKRIPYIFLSIVMIILALAVFNCFNSVGTTKIINVNIKNFKTKTYKRIDVGENSFQTGSEGRLFWKVRNLKEAFLISASDKDEVTNFYDLTYLFILNIALFIMVYRMDENSVFSNQVVIGMKAIAYSVLIYSFINVVSYKIIGYSIECLTEGQFTSQFRHFNIPKYLVITYLILFLTSFISKGKSLQKEQELTI